MFKKVLVLLLMVAFSSSAGARSRTAELPEARSTNKKGVENFINRVNDFLVTKGIGEPIKIGNVDVTNAGQFLNSVRGLKAEVDRVAKENPIHFEALKESGQIAEMIRTGNEITRNADKFKTDELGVSWASIPNNVFNIGKAVVDPSTNKEPILGTLKILAKLSQSAKITKAAYENAVAAITKTYGITLTELLKCR